MTKNVLIFFSFKKHKTGYYAQLFDPLKKEQDAYGLNLVQGSLKDLYIEVINNKLVVTDSATQRTLDTFDYVFFELWLKSPQQALAAATFLERHHVQFGGHEALNLPSTTKIGELVRMADNDLPLPRTFMSSYNATLTRFKANPPIAYPFVAKAADAYGGMMNYLVHSYAELKTALSAHKEQFFVLQEFIPNDCDYRVLVMGGEIKLVMRRTRPNADTTHLNNTSAGASGEFVDVSILSDAIQADALKAARLTLRQDFAGVDVMIDKQTGEHYILEVNEAPAIQMGEHPEIKIAAFMKFLQVQASGKADNDA